MSSYKQIIYTTAPTAGIDPSLTSGTFRMTFLPKPTNVPADKVLVRTHYLSLDPAMRQWLTGKRSYIAPVEIGAVMRGQSIAQIISVGSNLTSRFQTGDWVIAYSGWAEYAILGLKEVKKVIVPHGGSPRDAMSVLGITGLTAYFGMMEVGKPKAGETVVVSGAAGATGSIAGQIAKIHGAKRVVGLAGSKEKCEFLVKELAFDVAINYKDADWRKQLEEATPEYIDVFFDNTGGEILEACLARAAKDARFAICGAISQYNSAKPHGPASFMTVIFQRVTLKGFIFFDYAEKYSVALQDLGSWLAQGKLKRREHIVKGGIDVAPQALVDLYKGLSIGHVTHHDYFA
ncbi:alcohol dehydrogenase [Mariannaea sp. PMI_226]|nr:alcohol dehydrogenase [Mariannaea sp. PMI_226]